MKKAEIIQIVAKKANVTQAQASAVFEASLQAITEGLAEGETVTLVGFGIFTPKRKNERMGRNPKTGAPAVIHAKNTVSFKMSKGMKDILNP